LALVPVIVSDTERRAHQRKRRLLGLGVGAVLIFIGSAALVIWRLQVSS
jgi:hypothetical protein